MAKRWIRSTAECEQMNAVYAALDELRPTTDQLRELWREAVLQATNGTEEDRRAASLFVYQIREHIRRRTTK